MAGCRLGCDPDAPADLCDDCRGRASSGRQRRRPRLETLPLGITEDRLLGTLDLEHALRTGEKRFEPGLLARVHRGILYVDEVNLLEDHLVDVLLDVAASGVNTVEREGVGLSHPARFLLVGTMNPEEGELRPQLLDRFGLCVDVGSVEGVEERAEIIARRLAFERDPQAFAARFAATDRALAERIVAARALLPRVQAGPQICQAAARASLRVGVDGHRADILLVEAAVTLAALDGRTDVTAEDLVRAAPFAYAHRMRRAPFDEGGPEAREVASVVREALDDPAPGHAKKGATRPVR